MKKGNPWALLPILCFLVVFIGMGVWLNDFYAMPAIVGFLIALGVAFCQNRKRSFSEKMDMSLIVWGIQCDDYVSGLCNGWGIFRRSTGCRRRRQHSKLFTLHFTASCCGSRLIYYWMFYFYRNGHLGGHHCGLGSDRSRN